MAAVELANAFVSLNVRTDDIPKQVNQALGKSATGAEKHGQNIGSKMSSGITGFLGKAAKTAGFVGVGAAAAGSIMGGMRNAMTQQNVERTLGGLYGSAEKAGDMMDRLSRVSWSSPIEYQAYASAAESLAYMAIDGEQAENILRNVGDAMVTAGKDSSAMDSATGALTRMVNAGKVQMDTLQQLSNSGVPIIEGLATHMGVTTEELNKMVSDGAVGIEDVLAVMENGTGEYFQKMIEASDDVSGSFQNQWKMAKDNISQALGNAFVPLLDSMAPVIETLGRVLPPAIETVTNLFRNLFGWISDNRIVVYTFGAFFGTWATLTYGLAAAMAVKTGVLKGLTAAWALFNKVLRGNVFVLIASALAAVVAGLVYFFTQTEMGKEIWDRVWNGIKDAVSWAWGFIQPIFESIRSWFTDTLVPAVMSFWQDVVQPAFEAIGNVIKWVWDNVISVYLGLWRIYIMDILIPAIMWLWQNVVQPAFEAIGNIIAWVWNNVVKPAWDAMRAGLEFLGAAFTWIWENIIQPTWTLVGNIITWLWENVAKPMWDNMKAGLNDLGTMFKWVWENLIKPAWDAVGAIIRWLWDNVAKPYWDNMQKGLDTLGGWFERIGAFIERVWNAMGDAIKWVKDNVIDPVFDGIKRGLDTVGEWFDKTQEFIARVWNKVREGVAAPIRFVVETIYNNGIRRAWNAVATLIPGVDDLDPVSIDFATGGVMPGYTPGRDVHHFVSPTGGRLNLSGGEAIMRPEWTKAVGGPAGVEQMNRAARTGGAAGVRNVMEQSFASGGIMQGTITTAVQRNMWDLIRSRWGHMTLTSGTRGTNDHHGSGLAIDVSDGTDTTPAMQQIARWIHSNYGSRSLELIHWPLQGWQNIKNGSPLNYGEPTNSQHRNHVHWAMAHPPGEPGNDDEPEGGWLSGVVGAVVGTMRRAAAAAFDAIMDPIGRQLPEPDGSKVGAVPKAAFDHFRDTARTWLLDEADKHTDGDSGGIVTDSVSGPVKDVVRQAMEAHGWHEGAQWDAVDFIVQRESSWNPNAQNPTSTAYGLFQFLDSTWATVGGQKTSDPYQQGVYGGRYIAQRYGTPTSARAFWERNHWYDQGGLAKHIGAMLKNTNKPERVLSPQQTQAFEEWMNSGSLSLDLKEVIDQLHSTVEDLMPDNTDDLASRWQKLPQVAAEEIASDFFSVIGLNDPRDSPFFKVAEAVIANNRPGIDPRTGNPYEQAETSTTNSGPKEVHYHTFNVDELIRKLRQEAELAARGYTAGTRR